MPLTEITYADLLAQLQALTPEQLAQPVHVWGESVPYVTVEKLTTAAADYVCEDGECWEVEDETDEVDECEIAVRKGEIWLSVNY